MFCLFFFNDTATTEIYTLSLHDALPILCEREPLRKRPWEPTSALRVLRRPVRRRLRQTNRRSGQRGVCRRRSEEHTSELQSQSNLVCRLLLEKKKKKG